MDRTYVQINFANLISIGIMAAVLYGLFQVVRMHIFKPKG